MLIQSLILLFSVSFVGCIFALAWSAGTRQVDHCVICGKECCADDAMCRECARCD